MRSNLKRSGTHGKLKNSRIQEFRSQELQEFRSSGVQEFRSSGVRSQGVTGG